MRRTLELPFRVISNADAIRYVHHDFSTFALEKQHNVASVDSKFHDGEILHSDLMDDLSEKAHKHLAGEQLHAIGFYATSQHIKTEVMRIASLTSTSVDLAFTPAQVAHCVLRLIEYEENPGVLEASFHPSYAHFFSHPPSLLHLPDENEQLLEFMLEASVTRRGYILGVVSAHGGAGTSTLAAWIASAVAKEHSTCLIDMDPLSSGNDYLLQIHEEPGVRWPDLYLENSALIPRRLADSLPQLGNLRVLSADSRGGAPIDSQLGKRALAALSQVHKVCILDLPGSSTLRESELSSWLDWCDTTLLLSGSHPTELRSTHSALKRISSGKNPLLIVRGARSSAQMYSQAEELGANQAFFLHEISSLEADLLHGLRIGQRRSSRTHRDIQKIIRASLSDAL